MDKEQKGQSKKKEYGNSFKQDINLLDKPIWVVEWNKSGSKSINELVYNTGKGNFTIRYGTDKAPDRTNMVIFHYLFMLCRANNDNKIKISKNKILTDCSISNNSWGYSKVKETADIFVGTKITAENCWYDNKEYKDMLFTVMDSFKYDEKSGLVEFRLNEEFVNILNNSSFMQIVNFQEYKMLNKAIALRLYEILITKLLKNIVWEIECSKLAEKLVMVGRCPSELYRRVKAGIDEINEKCESLKVEFYERRSKTNTKLHIFVFKRLKSIFIANDTNDKKSLISDSFKAILEQEKKDAEECYTKKGGKCINIILNRFNSFDMCKYCKANKNSNN